MASPQSLLLALLAILCAFSAHAQFFSWFSPDPPPPRPPGAGQSVSEVICTDEELTTLCKAARAARRDATVAELEDPTFTGTIFTPTDDAFVDDAKDIQDALGVSIFDLPDEPQASARLIAAHIITGTVLQYGQLDNGQKYRTAGGGEVSITTGYLYGKYINGARFRETEGENNIPAARAVLHKIKGVIVPKD